MSEALGVQAEAKPGMRGCFYAFVSRVDISFEDTEYLAPLRALVGPELSRGGLLDAIHGLSTRSLSQSVTVIFDAVAFDEFDGRRPLPEAPLDMPLLKIEVTFGYLVALAAIDLGLMFDELPSEWSEWYSDAEMVDDLDLGWIYPFSWRYGEPPPPPFQRVRLFEGRWVRLDVVPFDGGIRVEAAVPAADDADMAYVPAAEGQLDLILGISQAEEDALVQAYYITGPAAPRALIGPYDDLCIEAVDAGQASLVSFYGADNQTHIFFDVGHPLWFNAGSRPNGAVLNYRPANPNAVVVLSHWDFDHYFEGKRRAVLHGLTWVVPAVPSAPNAKKFANSLPNLVTLPVGSTLRIGHLHLERASGAQSDPNNSGIVGLWQDEQGHRVLLTGDAAYGFVPPHMRANLTALTIPHHASLTDHDVLNVPPPAGQQGKAVACAGQNNRYGHPVAAVLGDHGANWVVDVTGNAAGYARGNKRLR
ncbi:hypothetical protein ACFSM5_16145 [Lacibacterium aquatile]|uniref:MBL fold metallo-hydrolase n=1 Tax=Lacibacterium aquatile TaxID=1168082 RepID=A0ABW5DWW4_9PROT